MLSLLAAAVAAAALPLESPPARDTTPLPSILVSTEWLAEHLDEPDLVVVHVGHRRAAYDAAHVPGARFLAYARIATEVDGLSVELPPFDQLRRAFEEVGVGDDVRVVIVGDPMSAARTWATLDWLGFGARAAVLDGGMIAWRRDGRPVSRERPAARPATLTAQPQRERWVDAAWVRARLDDPRIALVDARPADEYTGADRGHGGMHRAGHVPGAHNLYWERLLVSRRDPRYRPTAELRRLFEASGAAPGDTVVSYCFIGMRASVTYFVSRLLGYDTHFYDGSWDDWSRRGLPAVKGSAPGSLADAR